MNQLSTENESSYFSERPVLLVAILFLVAAIPVGMLIVLMYGSVSGSEFSPDDFTRRQFTYQRIPWIDLTLSGIEYTDITTELEQTLTTSGFVDRIKPAVGKSKTWHLYHDSMVPDSHACDARFLTTYMDFTDWDSNAAVHEPYWLKWNERYPRSARILWPTIADLARNEMYLIVPDVMRLAMNTTSDQPVSFQSDVNDVTLNGWIIAGEADLQAGTYQRAMLRLLRAELIEPSDKLSTLIELCQKQVKDASVIKSLAEKESERLKSMIVAALADEQVSAEKSDASVD